MNRIGMLQGRLLPKGDKLQTFPSETWEREFEVAKELGFDCLELLFDADDWLRNPLMNKAGIDRIAKVSEKTKIPTPSLCADFFQKHTIWEDASMLKRLISACVVLRCRTMLVPLFTKGDINDKLIEFLRACCVMLEDHHVRLGLETNLAAPELSDLIKDINNSNVGVYYDLGNSVYLGHDTTNEIRNLGDWIFGVHVKDRNSHGDNVLLGTGMVDFEGCFQTLNEINYQGDYILETCVGNRPIDYATIDYARYNLNFVRRLLV